jgi:class 3 adenylate cyclase/predicted ATPase
MKFSEVVTQTLAWLQREGRVSYRALRLEFDLTADVLDALKEELIEVKELAVDKDGKMLVWVGASPVLSLESRVLSPPQPPASYTPAHLAERIRAEQAALEARGATDGERKTITALFADLKGSTALIEGLDPEEARAVIDPALQLMMDAVHQYDGYVAQALGDGIFALFGAPLAHEDHPQRALYAALRMQEAMRRYADTLRAKGYPPLLMRVGLNTGEVVLRSIRKDDLHADYVPVGHSTNLAARMEQLATPGSIVVSAYTHRLTDGYFAFKDLGPTQIKGVEDALNIYEVLSVGPLRTRLQVSARRGLTRFVGRRSEMEQLTNALEQAKAGHGQIVGTMGEPGLGKSRLFYEFVGAHGRAPLLVLQAYSVSHGKATAHLPVIELLKTYFRIESSDDERTRQEKVTGKVLRLDRSLEDTLPYLFALLGIEEQPSPLQQMDAQIRRRRTFEALKKLFLRESLNQPLVLIFEDLHWIDGETQGFLDVLSESVASAKILLLANYRPEYRHEWGQKTYYTQLRLAPLGREEAEEFLDALLGESVGATGRSPLRDLKRLILEKTQGTPFFMEEIVQELVEQGVLVRTDVGAALRGRPPEGTHIGVPLQGLHIPPTVQGILAARIDRLAPDEKALLQQLAVIGRQFPLSLVRQVITQPEADLYRLLASLQHKEFLYEQPAFPESEYIFKHALTQEVAYGTVLQEQRKLLHERTGQALETVYTATLSEHYSDLAHHYQRSANTEKAITYLHLAGQQAVQRSSNMGAISHFTAALELLLTRPETPERAAQELTLQLALAPPLRATKGLTAPEAGAVSSRALELCRQVGETPQLFGALANALTFHLIRAESQTTRELAERLMSLAQRTQDPALLLDAHWNLALVSYSLGEWVSARAHFEQAVALYDPRRRRAAIARVGVDFGVPSLSCLASVLWALGYPDQARTRSRAGLSLAQETAHPDTTALAWLLDIRLYQFLREARIVQQRAEAVIMLCDEQGLAVSPWGIVAQGWALAMQGQAEEGITQVQQGMAALRAAGAEFLRPYHLALLAEAYGKTGQVENGLTALAEALAAVDNTGQRTYEVELYRLKGTLTLQSKVQSSKSKVEEAEACFLKAIDVAHKQQAKSLELRAVMSLARLWQRQGKHTDARQQLAEIYGWFTEGFDTKDLQEAQALLESLSP